MQVQEGCVLPVPRTASCPQGLCSAVPWARNVPPLLHSDLRAQVPSLARLCGTLPCSSPSARFIFLQLPPQPCSPARPYLRIFFLPRGNIIFKAAAPCRNPIFSALRSVPGQYEPLETYLLPEAFRLPAYFLSVLQDSAEEARCFPSPGLAVLRGRSSQVAQAAEPAFCRGVCFQLPPRSKTA